MGERIIHTDIPPQHILYLFLLESPLDNKTTSAIHAPRSSHLRKQELNNVFRLSVHSFTDIRDICEDRFFVSFSMDGGWGNRVSFTGGG